MKLCKDCYHFEGHHGEPEYAICDRAKIVNMVNGATRNEFCSVERQSASMKACGPDAQWFQPQTPETKPHDNPNPLVQDG